MNMSDFREIRVFPRITGYTPIDELAFIGLPPMEKYLPSGNFFVSISVVWTWDILYAFQLRNAWKKYYNIVNVGGPAFDEIGGLFSPGRFVRNGIIFTSRGCNRKCPWCYVQKRENKIRELQIHDGFVVEDSNLLMTSGKHIKSVFSMLHKNNHEVFFNGGFDARLFTKYHIDLLDNIKVGEIYFACDHKKVIRFLNKVSSLLINKPQSWKFCYVLIGYNETLEEARQRLIEVKNLCFSPIVMLYQKDKFIHHRKEWIDLKDEFFTETRYMKLVDDWKRECMDFQLMRFKRREYGRKIF